MAPVINHAAERAMWVHATYPFRCFAATWIKYLTNNANTPSFLVIVTFVCNPVPFHAFLSLSNMQHG
ncbi:hypothetical protein BDW22DRAFT_1360842 [Trametopsis cervina]|nr:hypothetical protein BDW22DRAFT_1360842 [Trametopsis cervina]